MEHLRELRKRLIISIVAAAVAAIICFFLYDFILYFLFRPFKTLDQPIAGDFLFVNTIFEGFVTKLKVSLLCGVIISLPVHLYNGVRFIFPGLTGKEKKMIAIVLTSSFVLTAGSGYYSYFSVIPLSVAFLTNSGFIPQDVGLLLNFGQNIFYIFQFILAFIILFQMPIVLVVLMAMNVVPRKTLFRASRYILVGIFVLAALLTPPDFVSQVSLALPLVLLFFLAILIAKAFRLGEG